MANTGPARCNTLSTSYRTRWRMVAAQGLPHNSISSSTQAILTAAPRVLPNTMLRG